MASGTRERSGHEWEGKGGVMSGREKVGSYEWDWKKVGS